ncbi:MAG: potassium transporter TrkG, partial [Eubacteriales bacterium]
MRKKIRRPLGITRLIAIGFLAVILVGTFLLVLPFSARKGEVTPFTDALFTAASAACVTGLTVFDTYSHWNFFGQLVILALIQIGGLGFVTVIAVFAQLLHHRVSLRERMIIRQSAGSLSIGGVTVLVKKVVAATAVFELSGAILLAFRF